MSQSFFSLFFFFTNCHFSFQKGNKFIVVYNKHVLFLNQKVFFFFGVCEDDGTDACLLVCERGKGIKEKQKIQQKLMELVQRKQAMIKGQPNRQNMQRQETQVGGGEKLNIKQLDQAQQKLSRKQAQNQSNKQKQPKVKQQKVKPLPVPKILSNIQQDSSPIQLQLQPQPTQIQLSPLQQEILLTKDSNPISLQTQNETSISQSQPSLNHSKKTFLFIDAGYIEESAKAREFAVDYIKFVQVLETQLQCSFEERWYFTSVSEDKITTLKTLRSPAPNGPHFIVKNHDLKKTTCKRCHKDQQIQRGVDVAIATQILKASYQNLCDRIVFVTGDGDFEECIRVSKEECKKEFTIVGFNNLSIHSSITQYASKVLYLDKLIPSFQCPPDQSTKPQNCSQEELKSKSKLQEKRIKIFVKPKFDKHQEQNQEKPAQVKAPYCSKSTKPIGKSKFDKYRESKQEPTETKELTQIQFQNYSKERSKSNPKPQGIKTIVKPKFDKHQGPTETKYLTQFQFQVKPPNCFKEEFKSESKSQEKETKKFDKHQEEATETKDLIQIQTQVKTQSEPKLQSKLESKIKQELDDGVSSCSIC